MATYDAIAVVSQSILDNLQQEAVKTKLGNVKFKLFGTTDFATQRKSSQSTVSLYLYHVTRNAPLRNLPTGRPDGSVATPSVVLDLHYMFTVWAKDAATQQLLFGWLLRTLNNCAIIRTDNLKIMDDAVSWELISNIWSRLDAPYQLSYAIHACNVSLDEGSPGDQVSFVNKMTITPNTAIHKTH